MISIRAKNFFNHYYINYRLDYYVDLIKMGQQRVKE